MRFKPRGQKQFILAASEHFRLKNLRNYNYNYEFLVLLTRWTSLKLLLLSFIVTTKLRYKKKTGQAEGKNKLLGWFFRSNHELGAGGAVFVATIR